MQTVCFNEKQLTLLAELTAKPGKSALLHEKLKALVPNSRKETGCIHYDLYESSDCERTFVFHETWATKADWGTHMKTPALTQLISELDTLLDSDIKISQWVRNNSPIPPIPSANSITLSAEMKAKPGMAQTLAAEFNALIFRTRGEAGCVHFDLHRSWNEADQTFLFHQTWYSTDHWLAHMKSPHLEDFLTAAKPLIEGDVIRRKFKRNLI